MRKMQGGFIHITEYQKVLFRKKKNKKKLIWFG